MSLRLVSAAVLITSLGSAAAAQTNAPNLTRPQRAHLAQLIDAVDRAAMASPASPSHQWLTHVLRASDGSHYIAVSFAPPPEDLPSTEIVIYVRLATAKVPGETTALERSVVREWLQGSTIDPRLLPRRGMAVGDMPAMGAGASIARGGRSAIGSADLQILGLTQERERQRREEEEKRRRSELDGSTVTASDRFPFEDFEVASAATFADGSRAIQRALTAGPGAYDLFVAWVEAALPAATAPTRVARIPLRLAPATTDFGLSSVIVADRISVRATPLGAIEQRAHPYSLGPTEIVPARDLSFSPAERLSVAFQIVNAMPSDSGKPSVVVNPRIVRLVGLREEPVATLTPLTYDTATVPADFDLRLGHPLIAALAVPLATLRRGDYKLVITAEDRQGSAVASTVTPFSVISTPAGLLAEAPPLAQRLTPAAMLNPAAVTHLIDRLAIVNPSPSLSRALAAARAGRFADLLIEDPVADSESASRAVLTGVALLSVGDLGALAHFQRATQLGARPAAVQYLIGASLSLQRRDADAIAAWEKASADGLPKSVTAPLIANLRLARGEERDAAAALTAADIAPGDHVAMRTLAATRIALQREGEAINVLDQVLTATPDDLEARWLLVRALFAQVVRGAGDRTRFAVEAQRYVDGAGSNAPLVREWLTISS